MVPFACCCNYATVGHIGMEIFNFIVLSVLTPHVSKNHLLISSLNVKKLMLKRQFKKNGRLPCVGGGSPTPPPQNLKNY